MFQTKVSLQQALGLFFKVILKKLDNAVFVLAQSTRIERARAGLQYRQSVTGGERKEGSDVTRSAGGREGGGAEILITTGRREGEDVTSLWNCVICVPWEEYQQHSLLPFHRLYPQGKTIVQH